MEEGGGLPNFISYGETLLILKKDNPVFKRDYRPLTLLTTTSKFISKLANDHLINLVVENGWLADS